MFTQLNVKTIPFQTIQFSISIHFSMSTQFSTIWHIDRILPGATTPGQSGPGSNGNEGELPQIPQTSCITRTTALDHLVSYLRHSLGKSKHTAEV